MSFKKNLLKSIIFLIPIIVSIAITIPNQLIVKKEVVGFLSTNCYLIYDADSKEAALIDPGDKTPSLLSEIEQNQLKLKYIFFTHCHPDHMYGIISMKMKEKFSEVKICFAKEGYKDMFDIVAKWREVYPNYIIDMINSNTEAIKVFDMDYEKIGEPDIYIEDGQIFNLGVLKIKAIKTPGHARGSVSFYIENYLFSGDELQYGKTGGTDISPISSFETQFKSIRKLYELPDETVVYPGHGPSSSIGYEKKNNTSVKAIE